MRDKTVIESLEQIALVEPTADASSRAIERARQAVLQLAPVKRRRPVVWVFVATGCAVGIAVLLVPLWIHFQRGEERPVAQAPLPATGPSSRGNIQALPGSMPGSLKPGPAGPAPSEPAPGSGPSGPAPSGPAAGRPSGPAVAGAKPPPAAEPSGPIPVPGKPRSQEIKNPPVDERDDEAAFDSLTATFKAPLSRKAPEQIRIDGDGSCLYTIDVQPARGAEPARPGAILKSQLTGRRIAELERLLVKTDWLKAEGGEGRALHTDAGEVKITVVRDGKSRTITCLGQRPEPYRSLLWFLQGIAEQEFRVHQLTGGSARERDDACRTIRFEIEALTGQWGRALPHYDFDYSRYVAPLVKMIREPKGISDEQLIAAIKLVTYVGAESEFEAIASLKGDGLRSAMADSIADFGGERAVPILARIAPSNSEAMWGLIRQGEIAIPTLVQLIEAGTTLKDVTSQQAVRAYLEHWTELPEPVDERIVKAVREAVARAAKRTGRNPYYEAFLKLVESDPVPPAGLSCRIERSAVSAAVPLRFVHGWYVVTDGRIVEEHAAPAPEPGTKYFDLKFEGQATDDLVRLRTTCRTTQVTASHFEPADMKDEKDVEVPAGARLEVVYSAWLPRHPELIGSAVSTVRISTQFRTLWEGHLIKDGRTVKRIVYVARVARTDESPEKLWPPAAPAAPKGGPAPPPPVFVFRGVELTDELKLTDPATLNDLAIAGRNAAIREQGGTPTGTSRTEVTDKTVPDDAGREFVVYRDPKLKLEYVQVLVRAPGQPLKVFWYGPLEEGRLKKARPLQKGN
jgi:hypothetical protein